MDRLRSEEAVLEDIRFLNDQRTCRKMAVGERDEEYDESIADRVVRDTRIQRMREKRSSQK